MGHIFFIELETIYSNKVVRLHGIGYKRIHFQMGLLICRKLDTHENSFFTLA